MRCVLGLGLEYDKGEYDKRRGRGREVLLV